MKPTLLLFALAATGTPSFLSPLKNALNGPDSVDATSPSATSAPPSASTPSSPAPQKRDFPAFQEKLRGPCRPIQCADQYKWCKMHLCPVNQWGCSKVCYLTICHNYQWECQGCHYC